VSRSNNGADALNDILHMCEQTLAGLAPDQNRSGLRAQVEKAQKHKSRSKRKIARRFILIQGGLLRLSQKLTGR